MNCQCSGLGSAGKMIYGGLGQVDPTSAALAIADAKHLWDDFIKALGIGAGRREADVVVPVQNRIFDGTIAPIIDYLTGVRNGTIQPDCSVLKNDLAVLDSVEKQWLAFLHDTQWQDGRAAEQGEATLAPWITNARAELKADIVDSCGGISSIVPDFGHIFTTATGGINWPVVAIAGGAAFMLLRRK